MRIKSEKAVKIGFFTVIYLNPPFPCSILQKAVKPRNTRNIRKNQYLIFKHRYTEKVNFMKHLTT